MAEGRERSRWNRAGHLMALVANIARDKKKRPRPFSPSDFNPYSTAKETHFTGDKETLREIFVNREPNPGNRKRGKRREKP